MTSQLLGMAPIRVRPTGSRSVFLVDLPGRTVVAKLAGPTGRSGPLVEAWIYRVARSSGVRVPGVLAVREECVLVEALPGVSLWRDRRPADVDPSPWHRAGADLRALHEIRLPGFGPLVWEGDGPRGRASSWCPFARDAQEHGLRKLADAGVLDHATARRLEERFDEAAELVNGCTEGRLLHGDLEGGHIHVDGGSYQGIIDFDQSQAGDPRWDLARVPLWDGQPALDALLDGYGRDILRPGDRDLLLPLYLLAFVVSHAVRLVDQADLGNVREHLAQTGYQRLL